MMLKTCCLGFLTSSLLLLSACNFKEDKTEDTTPIGDGTVTQISFADVRSRVFEPACSCHVAGNTDGVSLNTYEATLQAIRSRKLRFVTLEEKSMPPPPQTLNDGQIELLNEWLAGGAPL